MGLISDLLRDSPLKPEQLENIAVIEKRMQDEKLSANRELDRLKAEFDRVRTELDQARGLVRMLEQEVTEWRRQIKSGFDDSGQPGAEAGSCGTELSRRSPHRRSSTVRTRPLPIARLRLSSSAAYQSGLPCRYSGKPSAS